MCNKISGISMKRSRRTITFVDRGCLKSRESLLTISFGGLLFVLSGLDWFGVFQNLQKAKGHFLKSLTESRI